MPIDCEPWPGKTNANFISSSLDWNDPRMRRGRARRRRLGTRRAASSTADQLQINGGRRMKEPVTEDRRAPREAAADAFDQHVLSALDAAVAHRDVERERNRRRRGIAVVADRHHHALL